ncbi:hypothetical protein GH891_30820, partial [Bacillus thuringiensis]|nr:hypothetical protein [Bacillus thuringiensis]
MNQVSDQLEVAIVQGLEKHVRSFMNKGVVAFTPSTLDATLLRMKGEVERLFQDKYAVLDLVDEAIGLSQRNRYNQYNMSPLEMAKFHFIKEELKFSVAWTRQDILNSIEEYLNKDKELPRTKVNVLSLLANEDNFGSNEEMVKFIDGHELDILKDFTRHIYLTMNKET